jgi:hypothetical protein
MASTPAVGRRRKKQGGRVARLLQQEEEEEEGKLEEQLEEDLLTTSSKKGRKKHARAREDENFEEEDPEDLLLSTRKRLKTRVHKQVEHLRCSITRELMCDPVIAQDGNTYEKSELLTWLASKSTSPLDPSCKLNSAGLIVNRVVKQQIEELVYSGEVDDEERADWLERKALFEASLQERQDEQARVRRQCVEFKAAEKRLEDSAVEPYMHKQRDLNERMRSILVDWLVSTHRCFDLCPAALHLCIALLDRYCEKNQVQRSEYQLVGTTALLIASRCFHAASDMPTIDRFEYMTDGAAPVEQIVKTEVKMMRFFRCHIQARPSRYTVKQVGKLRASPTMLCFTTRLLRLAGIDVGWRRKNGGGGGGGGGGDDDDDDDENNTREDAQKIVSSSRAAHRAMYFTDRLLQEHRMLEHAPSLLAAASVFLALSMERDSGQAWTAELKRASGYGAEELLPIAEVVVQHLNTTTLTASNRPLDAVRIKYECRSHLRVGAYRYAISRPVVLTAA